MPLPAPFHPYDPSVPRATINAKISTLAIRAPDAGAVELRVKTETMKYFVYCRKSSEAEDRQVLSIDSQESELRRAFAGHPDIQIVATYTEAFSAKAPGRVIFDEMISRIERGEADGIIAWHPDRLARNSIDGGRIIYLLDRKKLHDLKFATFGFENNPQGKFMLSITFGYSKYYVDSLSENVKRGNRAKVERGWRPNMAPLGYLNDPATKTIVKDPTHFPFVRQMYELMLTGSYTPKQIALMARDEWGFRTPKRKRIGGTPLAMSSIYKILSNPFYAGIIVWDGQSHPGKHETVVTIDEFERVQALLRRPGRPQPHKHVFPFTGMIRCGACGLMVTAEHKIKPSGRRYTYYHCTKRKLGPRCQQPSIQATLLECQIDAFLRGLVIPAPLQQWILEEIAGAQASRAEQEEARRQSIVKALSETSAQLAELTGLRLRNLLSDDEFLAQRQSLQREHLRLKGMLARLEQGTATFEPVSELIFFSNVAADWFRRGDVQEKRMIFETVSSNSTLTDKILRTEARKPFVSYTNTTDRTSLLAAVEAVRTTLLDPQYANIFENIRTLRKRFEGWELRAA